MQDETAKLAAALGEAQAAQTAAESQCVGYIQENNRLKQTIADLESRNTQLEIANINMDALLQEHRVTYNPNPASIDRG